MKYQRLLQEFQTKFYKAASNYIRKNVDTLKVTDPGKAFSILKRMGAQPGEDAEDMNTFSIPGYEHLSPTQAADKIAEHFSKVSREFPPLDKDILPERVRLKIANPESESRIPVIFEHEVYKRILQANKPKSGVPGDLPKKLITEFGPELSLPIFKIFTNVIESAKQGTAKWQASWKQELGIPLAKIPDPQFEHDLRVISITAFFSKVLENFFRPKAIWGIKSKLHITLQK